MRMDGLCGPARVPGDGEVGPELLREAQAYLECRRRGGTPPPPWAEAWERFYRLSAPRIRRVVVAYRLPESERDDCIQEVWKDIVAKLGEFRHDPARGRLTTWLSTLARH